VPGVATPAGAARRAPLRLAVLVSGSGTTLQNLLDTSDAGTLPAQVSLVIGSRPGLMGVERAARAGVPNAVVDRQAFAGDDVEGFSRAVFGRIEAFPGGIDLVCLAGWLSLLRIPDAFAGRVTNIHPALLPAFGGKGMYGRYVHEAVLAHGCKVSGCTVHLVDNAYDAGPIVVQRTCPVRDDDTPESLATRVFKEECQAYPEAIRLFHAGRLAVHGRRVRAG
jgi:formyltetrahydrofolate-dependent phosphoribosylglycinamide formyltransferase